MTTADIRPEDRALYDAMHRAWEECWAAQTDLQFCREQLGFAGKRYRAALRAVRQAQRAYAATPSGQTLPAVLPPA